MWHIGKISVPHTLVQLVRLVSVLNNLATMPAVVAAEPMNKTNAQLFQSNNGHINTGEVRANREGNRHGYTWVKMAMERF